ncbi:glia maturation factor beta-like [Octopus vulgaris]|uniref:Glia maturation factor beta-like n=2 Tax=Octopus TaxID=6643 RepID=A0AA36BBE6_OCTVU|nr:glia maturation factor beta-like [Octopus sinensis]CAI9730451.1 glia maturation factor beta-like [Octopus vulgaris]
MSQPVCELNDGVKERIKQFRFSNNKCTAAVILKVDTNTLKVIIDTEYEDCTMDEIQEELPVSQPRFIVLSYVYNHDDGRVSYPLIFIFVSPQGCKPEQQMLYAGSVRALTKELEMTKVFDVRSTDEFTVEWIEEKLKHTA